MQKRDNSFSASKGAILGAISVVALIIATIVSLSFDTGAPEDLSSPPSQVAAG